MKKLIVLLLAFAMVGAVSAQVTTAIGLSGAVTLVDEAGNGVFAPNGNGYDTWTFKATDKDGKYGFAMTDQNILDGGGLVLRDWTVWGKMFGGKLSVGLLRDATFRLTLPYWAGATIFGGTDRISGQGVLFTTDAMNGLTLGVNLPYSLTAGAAADVLQKADVGVKYDAKGVGTVFALINLDLVTPANVLNAGFKFTGMKALTATVIAQAKFDADTYKVGAGVGYTGVEKLTANVEGAFTSTAGVSAYSVWAQGAYAVADAITATVGGSYATAGYDAYAGVEYDLGAGFSVEAKAGYNSALYAAATLNYGVAF